MSAYVLVVDGEPDNAALVAYHLARESYRVRTVSDGGEAVRLVERERPDLVVSGLDVLRELRARPDLDTLPIIVVTAGQEEQDRIEGMSPGADDCVARPVSPQELVLRIGAVLHRARQQPVTESGGRFLRVGPVSVDLAAAIARVDGNPLDLTPLEYRLLTTLMERRGRVQSRSQLLAVVWGTTADITTRTVDMHVQRLRRKLGPAARWLETVRGGGYRYRAEPPGT